MENLRIDNPCPMMLGRMDKNGDNFACKSCQKEVIDFRNKSTEEIANTITRNTCGVFYTHQLTAQQRMSAFRQTMFYALTVLSFLGFNVSPFNAAPVQQNLTERPEIKSTSGNGKNDDEKKQKRKTKKQIKRMKKHKFTTMGCPSF